MYADSDTQLKTSPRWNKADFSVVSQKALCHSDGHKWQAPSDSGVAVLCQSDTPFLQAAAPLQQAKNGPDLLQSDAYLKVTDLLTYREIAKLVYP